MLLLAIFLERLLRDCWTRKLFFCALMSPQGDVFCETLRSYVFCPMLYEQLNCALVSSLIMSYWSFVWFPNLELCGLHVLMLFSSSGLRSIMASNGPASRNRGSLPNSRNLTSSTKRLANSDDQVESPDRGPLSSGWLDERPNNWVRRLYKWLQGSDLTWPVWIICICLLGLLILETQFQLWQHGYQTHEKS